MIDNLRSEEISITVTKTILDGHPVTKEDKIQIRPFVTEPARVRVCAQRTVNLGDYNFVKMEVEATIPCYKEELSVIIVEGLKIVESTISEHLKDV